MNEFTKEELYILKDAMKHSVQRDIDEVHEQWAIAYGKIQHMIETYDTPQAIRERTEQHGGCF